MSKIYTFTAASGAGKTTIVRELVMHHDFSIVQSVTTRVPRQTDILGEYLYLTLDDFTNLEKKEDFLWTTPIVHSNRYGTLKTSVDSALSSDKNSAMILIPDVIPILQKYAPNDRLKHFYILSSREILMERLQKRGDDPKDIEKRIEECATWDDEARKSTVPYALVTNDATKEKPAEAPKSIIPYIFITNIGTKEEAVKKVLRHVV